MGQAWQDALESTARNRQRLQNATVLVLGRPNSGKSTLIRGLQRFAAGGADRLRPDDAYVNTGGAPILDAAAFPVRASTDVSGDYGYQTCALLVLQSAEWSDICGSILRRRWLQCGIKGTTLLIIVSLRDMVSAYEEAESWLKFSADFIPTQVEKTDLQHGDSDTAESFLATYADLREQTRMALMNARYGIEKQTAQGEIQAPDPIQAEEAVSDVINMGVQVVVCCCKADILPSLGFAPEKRNDELIFTVYMRELCRQYGASLLFINAEDDENSNHARLNTLITSPITKETKLLPPSSSPIALYVPAGWDTKQELEEMARGCGLPNLKMPLQTIVKPTVADKSIITNLENAEANVQIPVPQPFDSFLKSMVAAGEVEVSAPSETLKMVKILEAGEKPSVEETILTPEPPSVADPPSAPRPTKERELPTPGSQEPVKSTTRVSRDRPRHGSDSGRKTGTLMSSLLTDLKKSSRGTPEKK
eukprot:Protomagalhaensia_sp_Gyna_25__4084@NODE_36_length_6784_cov_145_152706_g25_i0_p2_GENE_NODE_36_length_6784_cov_145_152706_g25_i0NODE_36_length_6784_cov_145_152706_g25_i0_p2_ORF_typecomplete_len478_score82_43DLIC/PF05783_11/9_7e14RsgA_GTPase/PF03193_16/0_025RsgA_GTPase/PF03193_16/1_4e03RsgA_GTPase/PF03193_16/9_2MMR_HSR1/PF01926_23/0_0028AAA_16/PF13191_6/0_0075AAA_33/PF13671_6/0_014TniB/PF05621_11/0_026TniB/PF05621_11/3_1e03TniB/PF05621_11/7_6e03FeoB_N/PF02421_18/0_071FeoB_N/PF02421_18/1_6e03PPV_E1_